MKKIETIIVVMVLALLLTGCGQTKKKEKGKEQEKEPKVVDQSIDVTLSGEQTTIEENSTLDKLFRQLMDYGSDLYNKGSYKEYDKKNDMFFISLNQLNEKYGYDISFFKGDDGTVCDLENSGIYFDPDNVLKMNSGENFPPISPSLIGCSQNTIPKDVTEEKDS